jgi:hypothetical protein
MKSIVAVTTTLPLFIDDRRWLGVLGRLLSPFLSAIYDPIPRKLLVSLAE